MNVSVRDNPKGFTLQVVRYIEQFPVFCEELPSEDFLTALTFSGTDAADCEFCGRHHFSSEYVPSDIGDSTRESLVDLAEKHPGGKESAHAASSLSIGTLHGMQYVVDCPCNAATLYERLFWQHLYIIRDYTKKRAERQLETEKENLRTARGILVHS